MSKRTLDIKTNRFPSDFSGNYIFDQIEKKFLEEVEINLEELCARYFLEAFNDRRPIFEYGQFTLLNYLIPDVSEFKFTGKQPGADKDSRRDNSRILGQTICRYFVEKIFGQTYIANISNILNRNLPGKFSHISIKKKQKGDTPDYLFMDNNNKPCLAEAKGRRNAIEFDSDDFDKWRKQFDTVEILINEIPQAVKGYITSLSIANENNKLSNSILNIEDPDYEGEEYEDENLGELIKLAHYERILSKTYLNFIGNSLLSQDDLSIQKKFPVSVFKIDGFKTHGFDEIVSLNRYYQRFYDESIPFVGITLKTLERLLDIARGKRYFNIEDIKYENFNSVFFRFTDGFVVCNPNLLEFIERRDI
ncbi:hypothetical protein GSF70_10155 [Flavobacteriaceae bacterium W22]|nr:hypothetical protein [Flavobacteriaceae bacterium W22]